MDSDDRCDRLDNYGNYIIEDVATTAKEVKKEADVDDGASVGAVTSSGNCVSECGGVLFTDEAFVGEVYGEV